MSRKKTHKEFVEEIFNLVGNEYSVIGRYINTNTKIQMKHNRCNYSWGVKPNHFISSGSRCPKCSIKKRARKRRESVEGFNKRMSNLVGDEYIIVGEYESSSKKIELIHSLCNHKYSVRPNDFFTGARCPNCAIIKRANLRRKTHSEFEKELRTLVGDEYDVLEIYLSSFTKIKIKHNKCGELWDVRPANFLSGQRCPRCNLSKGEEKVNKWLKVNNIRFIPQYKIEECRSKFPLPFDFGILDKNNNVISLIEYDGEQHYRSMDNWGGAKAFTLRQKNDKIKNDYCKKNNIPLLRIPYWDFDNIEEILESEVFKYIDKRNK